MSHDRERSRGGSGQRPSAGHCAAVGTPGKTTLVEQLQRRSAPAAGSVGAAAPENATPPAQLQPADIHHAAARGVGGSPQTLPHLDAIQRSFGNHDVTGVRAFVGGPAASASREIGAQAYAMGDSVAFAGAPDLHTAAHEAAHVVQQRAGVQLLGGVGQEGDAYEQHADAVADLVVQGASAQATLDRFAPGAGGGGGVPATQHKAVQRAPVNTHYGTFKDAYFSEIQMNGTTVGLDMFLTFTPNTEVDATKIAFTQSTKSYLEGDPIAIDATKERQQVKSGAGKGYAIDQHSDARNPLFATGPEPAAGKDKLASYDTPNPVTELSKDDKDSNTTAGITGRKYTGWGQHGYRKQEGGAWKSKDAEMHDDPVVPTKKANSGTVFETTALAIDGAQKGTYYGSVSWGMKTNAAGKLSKVELAKASEGVPTQDFMAAAKQWNATSARGTLVTAAANTKFYDESQTEKGTLAKDVKLEQQSTGRADDIFYLFVRVASGKSAGETGFVKATDVKDKGDGKSNVDLPYVDVKLTKAAVKLYKAKDKKDLVVELPKDTRLKVVKTEGSVLEIEVVDRAHTGKTGWIDKDQIKDEA